MSDVLRSVRTSMTQVNGALNNVDTGGMEQVTDAAQQAQAALNQVDPSNLSRASDAADEAARRLAQINAQPMQQVSDAARSAATRLGDTSRAAQQVNAESGRAADAVQDIARQAQAAATDASRIGQGITINIFNQAAQAVEGVADAAREATRETEQLGDAAADAGQQAESAGNSGGSSFGEWAKGAAGAAAGILAVGGALDTVMESLDRGQLGNQLAAQLNLDPAQAAEAGRIAGDVYQSNFGESFEQVNETVGAVISSLDGAGDLGSEGIQKLTEQALTLSSAFGTDVAESAQSANNLIRNGLAKDGSEAFDLITAAMQRVPASMRGEVLPILDEYATNLSAVGLSGEEALGVIVNAAQGGAIAMDKAGDAVKEFGIKATDLGDTGAQDALKSLGLDSVQMSQDLLAGGDVANAAFNKIVSGLAGIENPLDQATASVALFGTPLEDLDKTKIPGFLAGLQNGASAMGDFAGTSDKVAEQLSQGPGAALDAFKRQLETGLVDAAGKAIQVLIDFGGFVVDNKQLIIDLGVVVGGAALAFGFLKVQAAAAAAGGLLPLLKSTQLVTTATKVWTGIQAAFNLVMAANPVALIVLALVALGAAVVVAYRNSETFREIVQKAWTGIKDAVSGAWDFIRPIFESIKSWIVDTLIPILGQIWGVAKQVFEGIGKVIGFVWENVIKPIFAAYKFYILEIVVPIFQVLWDIIKVAFDGISAVIGFAWNNIVKPIFEGIKFFVGEVLAPVFNFLWDVVKLAFEGIGNTISFIYNNVISPVWDLFKFGLDLVSGAVSFLWNDVIKPSFEGIGNTISFIYDNVISPVWDRFKEGLDRIGGFFSATVEGIKNIWSGLKSILAVPINFMIGTVYNKGIRAAWNKVGEFLPLPNAPELPLIAENATGGAIRGPGSGTSDDILSWLSNGEHVMTAVEVAKAGGQNIVYALRDMIKRGIPFEWDNGSIIPKLGRPNLERYGAAVQSAGYGNVAPEGLFDKLLPQYKNGGPVEEQPWMHQLLRGHKFAQANSPGPYIWGEWDCSAWLSRIADAILTGGGAKKWATGSFPGGQPWVPGLGEGFSVGVHDNPGGPGGGHTSGTLSAIPLLGIPNAVNVESGGNTGQGPTYGGPAVGADDAQWNGVSPGRFHLALGANGFFQSGGGGAIVGPAPEEQKSFIERKAREIFGAIIDPIKGGIVGAIGAPPPEWVGIPPRFLDTGADKASAFIGETVGKLGDALAGVWTKATNIGGSILDFVNPFDSGGIANGTGVMAKNVIAPERVLSPEQTALFEALVLALQSISKAGMAGGISVVQAIGDGVKTVVGDVIKSLIPAAGERRAQEVAPENTAFMQQQQKLIDEQGAMLSDTASLAIRTESSVAKAQEVRDEEMRRQLVEIANKLTGGVLGPVVQSAMDAALGVVTSGLEASAEEITTSTDGTTTAVQSLEKSSSGDQAAAPFGAPGSAFDAAQVLSDAVVSVANTASSSIMQVGQDIAKAALAQTPSKVDQSRGNLGTDISGGTLVDMIVRLTGVEIQIRDLLTASAEEVRAFRGDTFQGFDESGQLLSDTAALIERTETSREIAAAEQDRINKALIKALIKYLMLTVILPIITALLTALITVAVVAIGAAIGSIIPVIGPLIGAAIGAVIGVALSVVAAGFIATVGLGVAAGLDSFDSGGVATGIGIMPKNTIAPERVLSPQQTASFDRLVDAIAGGKDGGKRIEVHAPMSFSGPQATKQGADHLLSLLDS